MLIEVYIFSSENSLKFDLIDKYNNIKLYDCSELSKDKFISLHKKSLFSEDNKLTGLINVNVFENKYLMELLKSNFSTQVVWCFSKLDKRTSLYKHIREKYDILESKELSNLKEKKAFIRKYLKMFSVPEIYADQISFNIINDKFSIKAEIEKMSCLYKMNKEKLIELLSSHTSEQDLFEYVNNFIFNPAIAYKYAVKFKDIEVDYMYKELIFGLLGKKIKSYLYLSVDNINTAKRFWNTNNYYLNSEMDIAKKFGANNCLKLHNYIKSLFFEYNEYESIYFKLCSILEYVMDLKNEDHSCRNQNI